MPDLQTPPTDNRPPASPEQGEPDPLTHLHKMSTTAGLGSTDYVAINAPSVLAVILGLASALAVVDRILLIVPVAGVICAIVALYQIRKSAGTQTGTGLAIIGLLLSFGFVAYVGYAAVANARQERADKTSIEGMLQQLTGHIKNGEFDKAYALFSPRFQERVPQQQFSDIMKYVQNGTFGKLESISTNGRYDFNSDPTTGIRLGQAILFMKLDKNPDPSRQEAVFRLVGGQWKIENIPGIFPTQQQGGGAPGGGGG
jgi:hypothetical protein